MKKQLLYGALIALSCGMYACKDGGSEQQAPEKQEEKKAVKADTAHCSDCEDPACWEEYVIAHTISQGRLDSMAIKDANGNKMPPKTVSADYIRGAIESLNCNDFVFCCIDSSASITSNSEIKFQVRQKPDNELVEVYYQIQLFKGLLHQYDPTEFKFYNGVKENNKKDIVFEIVKNGTVVHCADLSNDWPPKYQ
ncbi:MAG: hypothetical protein ACK4EY_07780 [Flavipsychrobacter sp.]